MPKLSIIIPAYKAEPYIYELFDCLNPQITKEVEVMVIDDGSPIPVKATYPWIKIHRQENAGVSTARNYGIEHTTGEYIAFIDADDLVADDYVKTLIHKIDTEHFDYIELSWKSLPGPAEQYVCKMNSFKDKMQNPSACTRAFKRTFIGNVRFNTKKTSSEDENFTRMLDFEHGKRAIATEFMYFYRTNNPNSKSHRFWRGELDTRQIVYYYKHVTKDMTWLIDEIKKTDETNCVWLLTEQNDLPELEKYCRVRKPHRIRGMELRGEPNNYFIKVEPKEPYPILLYISKALKVSGINTFIYNFCAEMHNVTILYDDIDAELLERFSKVAKLIKNDISKPITCESIILVKLKDHIPRNVIYSKSIRMCHACKLPGYIIEHDCDYLVNVSEFSKDTWETAANKGIVINNIYHPADRELLLVSATRIQTADKGANDRRMRTLAEMLNKDNIPFSWLNFSDVPLANPPKNFYNMGARSDVSSFIKRADYLVQLSDDKEAFCYSILEALSLGTAVITTNLSVLKELGMKDKVHGYIVPFDMNFNVRKLLSVPEFEYSYDNKKVLNEWKKLFDQPSKGKRTGIASVLPDMTLVKVVKQFKDIHTGKVIPVGETMLPKKRVEEILDTQKLKNIKLIEVVQ